jgi:hypothetical protein
MNNLGDSVATMEYGEDLDVVNVWMESRGEDANLSTQLLTTGYGPDMDYDGYPQHDTLIWTTTVSYDSTYLVYARVFARNSTGHEEYCWETFPYSVTFGSPDYAGAIVSPGPHDLWDFRLDLYKILLQQQGEGELSGELTYDEAVPWQNKPLERWNEDPRENTIFEPNPVHSLNDPDLWDHNDSNFAVPEWAYVEVTTLPRLSGGGGSLTGTFARIVDYDPPSIAPPTSPDGMYPFFRGDDNFEAVMCYFWVDWSQILVQALGFNNIYNAQIDIDAYNNEEGAHNAFYQSTGGGRGWLGFGNGAPDAAEDAELIFHEHFHALIDNLAQPGIYQRGGDAGTNETRAMNEGFADYWGASISDFWWPSGFPGACFGEWFNRSTSQDPPYLRRLDTEKTYPDSVDALSYHRTGQIWSACLWEMMNELGYGPTGVLIFRSINEIRNEFASKTYGPSFEDGARALLRADSLEYAAAHALTITEIFRDKGILICSCPHQCDYDEDTFLTAVDLGTLIDVLFAGHPEIQDPGCPTSRGDFDCDQFPTALDLGGLIDHLFSGGDPPRDPCAP